MSNITLFSQKILFALVLIIFIFIPLYPKFPFLNISGTFVAVRIEDFLITLTLGVWILYVFASKRVKNLLKDSLFQAIMLFFFIGAVSLFSAYFLTHTVIWHLSIFHYLRRVEFILLLPAVFHAVNSKKKLVIILASLSFVLLLVSLYALGQKYLDWPVISTTNSEFSKGLILRLTPGARVNSTFAGHYDLAVFLAMALVLLSSLLFAVKKIFIPWLILLAAFSTVILIMTAARLSFIAALIGIILTFAITGKKKFIFFILLISSLILIYPSQLRDRMVSTITVNIFNKGQRYTPQNEDQRIRSKLNIPTLAVQTSSDSATSSSFATQSGDTPSDITPGEPVDPTQLGVFRSFEIRFNLEWPRAVNALNKNPLLGTGYSSIDLATDNDFLRSLGETGILGTIAIVLIIVESAKRIYKNIKTSDKLTRYFSAGVFCMLISFVLNGLFIDVFEASKVASLFWMMIGLGLSVKQINENT